MAIAEQENNPRRKGMDLEKLYQILNVTTVMLRKGEEVEVEDASGVQRVDVYAMPHESEAAPEIEKVDVSFVVIGVEKQTAEEIRPGLIEILDAYPQPERLKGGPSYIEVGAELGSQDAAFRLFALGQVLGFWEVITPEKLGITGSQARELAGMGMVMISGYNPDGAPSQATK